MQFTAHAGGHVGQTIAGREEHAKGTQLPAGGHLTPGLPEPVDGPQLIDVPLISTGTMVHPPRPGLNEPDLSLITTSAQHEPAVILADPINTMTDQPLVVRTVNAPEIVPDNSLFILHPGTDSDFLVETDPRFTRQKSWLNSRDIYGPDQLAKRLGDGYYEQKRVREQVLLATGQRFLTGYQDDETQYRDLLNQGKTFASRYGLQPGIALTAEQMALLTSDIVWMVNQTVTLADGSVDVVSVPRLYVRVKPGDLQGNGALLTGHQVVINSRKNLINSGTIHGQALTSINADNLLNQGVISGSRVGLLARQDIINQGGQLRGGEQLWLQAGNDILSQTENRQQGTERWLDRNAGIYVQGDSGELHLQAVRDIRLVASEIDNRGPDSQTLLVAGRDLRLDTAIQSHSTDYTLNRKNYDRTHASLESGSEIRSGGSLLMSAGQDITLRAAQITSGGNLTGMAGNNLYLESGVETREHASRAKWHAGGFLSRTTREHIREAFRQTALSTTLSGDTVNLHAGHDLTVEGGNIAGRGDVLLTGTHNLTLTTADEAWHQNDITKQKKSGLTGSGGLGFSVGSASQKRFQDDESNIKKGSVAGSSSGNVSLLAGSMVVVHGSELVAGRDLTVTGAGVAITAAQNSHTSLTRTQTRASGFSLALSGIAGSGINTAVQQAREAGREEDPRLAALRGIQAALNGVRTSQGMLIDQMSGSNNSIGLSLSYGSQGARTERKREQVTASGSTLTAGQNMLLTATEGNINASGAALGAGGDTSLYAFQDIMLASAANQTTVTGSNKSRGNSAGIGLGVGQGGGNISAFVNSNSSRGHDKGTTRTYTETTLESGGIVSLYSGRDTALTGARVSGGQIIADVGRSLTIASQQVSERYDSKQQSHSTGGSASWGSSGWGGTASVSGTRSQMESRYDAVQEQSGLFAGEHGFDVRVGGHTQLDAGVIGSAATADKNRLETGTLGFSNIRNSAAFQTQQQSAGINTGGTLAGMLLGNMASTLLAGVNQSGTASSDTRAAVSEGQIIIRNNTARQQNVDALSRDVSQAHQPLKPIFDAEKEQRRLRQMQLLAEVGSQVSDIVRTHGDISGLRAAKTEHPDYTPAQLRETSLYKAEMQKYGTGSALQQGIQAATAAIQGLAGGNPGQALAGASAPYLAAQIHRLTEGNPEAQAVAHAVVGAVTARASGANALAGAAGAVSGELMAQAVMSQLYPGRQVSELTETEKQTISALGTLAAGLAGGIAGGNLAGGIAGAQSGKNAAENNALGDGWGLPSGMMNYGQAVASWNQYAQDNNLTPEQTQAGLDKLAKGDLTDGANIAKVIVDGYKDGVLIAGAVYLGPAASVGKAVGGAVIAEIANGTYQWFDLSQPGNENKGWDYKSSVSSGISGMLTPGRTVWQNVGIAVGSAFFTDGPDTGSIGGAAAGAWAGGMFGEYAPGIVNSLTGKEVPGFIFDATGSFGSEILGGYVKDAVNGPQPSSEKNK